MMQEHFPLLAGWNLRIEGTDICAEVVERAQAGCYHRIEMNRGLPARFVVRYFDHHGEDWTVKPEVKKMCLSDWKEGYQFSLSVIQEAIRNSRMTSISTEPAG